MAMIGNLLKLARGPAGRKLLAEAQKAAQDPKNRERVARARARIEKAAGGRNSS